MKSQNHITKRNRYGICLHTFSRMLMKMEYLVDIMNKFIHLPKP